MTLSIKPARRDQIDVFPRLAKQTILTCYPSILGLETVEGYAASGIIETYFQDHWQATTCCYTDETLIGMATRIEDRVDLMIILPAYHRKGAGTRLLQALEDQLFEDHKTLKLDCFEKNDQAVQFYIKNGWVIDHRKVDEYKIDYVVMTKIRT